MSVPIIINGDATPQLNELQLTFRPFSGGEQGGTYEGVDAQIRALIIPLINNGYSVDYRKSKSPTSTLTFSSAFASVNGGVATNPNVDYKDTWELLRNTVQKELLESDHPYVASLNSTNLSELKAYISGARKLASDGIADFEVVDPPDNPNPSVTSADAAIYLFSLFQSGVKTVEVKQPILRLTRTTNPLYDAPFATYNIDTLLTTASMISDSGVPSNFAIPLIDLTTALMTKAFPTGIPDPPIQVREDGLVLVFAWIKDLVGETKHGSERVTYTLQYSFGLFDQNLYGEAT